MMMTPRILIILTSCDRLAWIGPPTGFRLSEFAAAWTTLTDAGSEVALASPLGGPPPVDPVGDVLGGRSDATRRFLADREARDALADTLCLEQVHGDDFDGLFFPGGPGLLGDLAMNSHSIALISAFAANGKPMGFVSEAPAALLGVHKPDGTPYVAGRCLTMMDGGGTLLAGGKPLGALLTDLGAHAMPGAAGEPHLVVHGSLVTGGNPASADMTASILFALALRNGP
ncbi:type 1 glutamine amidotransferase domain-containing protein [Niveispirillum irakense]|uniref:type 1 glutamine amidotransferase domain-containing protein n=1 Tax=Niveispirillum irakense TaxID=34011 RepID=UPI0003FDCE7A|nr:type 1 glutamine amidotransferase domain-containing protein [Niveispirillum irakense]